MKYSTNHPTPWFALGVYAAWYSGMLIGTRSTPNASRWNTEEGVWIGGFAAFFVVVFTTLPFAGWLKWRRRGRPDLRPKFFLPLVLGAMHPWLCILPLEVSRLFPKLLPAIDIVAPFSLFGWPLILCEGMTRWTPSPRT